MLTIFHADTYQRMPWKNGGGETVQLAIFPPGATLENFDWRISSARVASSGPFSTFPGVDRSLAVLSGGALHLHAADPAFAQVLQPGGDIAAFPGDWPMRGDLLDPTQPVIDFNVMTRRSRWRHTLTRQQLAASLTLAGGGWFGYLAEGEAEASTGDERAVLATGHSFLADLRAGPTLVIAPRPTAVVWLVSLSRQP